MSFLSRESVMLQKNENFSLSSSTSISTRFAGDAFDVRDDDTDDGSADRIGDASTFVGLPGSDASTAD